MKLNIAKENKHFVVSVDEGSRTQHNVTIDSSYYQSLTQNKISEEELLKWSFTFLLEREPKEMILRKFNLSLIQTYFGEYESWIQKKIAQLDG